MYVTSRSVLVIYTQDAGWQAPEQSLLLFFEDIFGLLTYLMFIISISFRTVLLDDYIFLYLFLQVT